MEGAHDLDVSNRAVCLYNRSHQHPTFDTLTHGEVLEKGLAVMDVAAVALARENAIPIIVFSIHEKGGFAQILTGGGRKTIVSDN